MSHDIKWIDQSIDYKKLVPLKWDATVNGKPYNVYHLEGYYHTIGSRYDDYWCCPADEKPCYANMRGYICDSCVEWGVQVTDRHYNNWKHDCVEDYINTIITRNGETFYEFKTHDMNYSFAKAQTLLMQIKEHPLWFSERDFDKKLIGRKIWWREQPAIITSYVKGQCCIMVKPDGIKSFTKPAYYDEYEWDPYEEEVKLDCLEATDIWWFRN